MLAQSRDIVSSMPNQGFALNQILHSVVTYANLLHSVQQIGLEKRIGLVDDRLGLRMHCGGLSERRIQLHHREPIVEQVQGFAGL